MDIKYPLNLTEVFFALDQFNQRFEKYCHFVLHLTHLLEKQRCRSCWSLGEVTIIVIVCYGSGYQTFKEFNTLQVFPHCKKTFLNLVGYHRCVEVMPWAMT